MISSRHSSAVAYTAAVVNLAAGAVMLLVLRQGLPAGEESFAARMIYVTGHQVSWRLGWLVWNGAAISLLALFVVLALRWRETAPILTRLALLCAAAGLAADLGAETILAGTLDRLSGTGYQAAEAIAVALTGYLGNGLYTVAGTLLTIAGRKELPPALLALGGTVWLCGYALSVATLAHSRAGQFWSAAILMPLFVAWAALLGRRLEQPGSA